MSIGERLLQAIVKSSVASRALCLLGTASLRSLVLQESSTGIVASSGSNDFVGTLSARERVQLLHHVAVLERVLLRLIMEFLRSLDSVELALDLVGVDNSGQIGAVNGVALKLVSTLILAFLGVGSEDLVESIEGRLGVDNESTNVATGSELEQVKRVHAARVNTGEVSCNTLDIGVSIVVDEERSLAHGEAGVTVLSVASTHLLGLADAFEVSGGTELVKDSEERASSAGVEAVAYKGELRHFHDLVAAGHNERSTGGGSKGRGNGVALLVKVHLAVPFAPDLERSEHATLTALVTECGLARAVSTGARNTGNSSHGTTSAPGLCRVLVALQVENTVGLAPVLAHVGVNEGNHIVADGSRENCGNRSLG